MPSRGLTAVPMAVNSSESGAVRAVAELDADDAVGADLDGLGDEPQDRVHPRGVHRLREHGVLARLHAAAGLEADVVDGDTHHELERVKPVCSSRVNSATERSEVNSRPDFAEAVLRGLIQDFSHAWDPSRTRLSGVTIHSVYCGGVQSPPCRSHGCCSGCSRPSPARLRPQAGLRRAVRRWSGRCSTARCTRRSAGCSGTGWREAVGVESGGGPDRKLYAITGAGVTELEHWLSQPEPTSAPLQNVLFAKVVLALMSGRPADQLLDAQRTVHVARMRELTARRHDADITERLATDFEIHHLEADLKWIETAGARLDRLRTAVSR